MTPTTPSPHATTEAATRTAHGFLFGGRDPVDPLAGALDAAGVVGTLGGGPIGALSGPARAVVGRKLAAAAAELTDVELGALVASAWQAYAPLSDAADRTIEHPGREEVVDLDTHRVRVQHHPSVDIEVDGKRVASVPFDLTLDFLVHALVAVVRDGHVVELRGGCCDLTCSFGCQGVELISRTAELDLEVILDLGDGVLLRRPAAGRAGVQRPAPGGG